VAIEVDTPTTALRATQLLFYLYHERVSLFVSEGEFVVQFETTCRHVQPDRRCGVYATRPHICRDYSEVDCEINSEDEGQTIYTPAELMAYLAVHHRRAYREVLKGYAPPDDAQSARGHGKLRLPLLESRFRDLRMQGIA
jgi:Fe-S-cluster containining protein